MAQLACWVIRLARYSILGAMLAGAAPVLGQTPEDASALSSLTIESGAERFDFQVELAATPEARGRGLMFRRSLPAEHGMLFDFGEPRPVAMWMRNTFISLDMLFIDQKGQITKIVPNTVPFSEEVIASDGPVRAVLELRGGVTAAKGIDPGDRIVHPLFSEP
jgi:uncharacterized membrane protein (UPF0127 family)